MTVIISLNHHYNFKIVKPAPGAWISFHHGMVESSFKQNRLHPTTLSYSLTLPCLDLEQSLTYIGFLYSGVITFLIFILIF